VDEVKAVTTAVEDAWIEAEELDQDLR